MAAVMPNKLMDPGMAAFAPSDGTQAIQTPYGSLQLASQAFQQQAMSLLGQTSASGFAGPAGAAGAESEDEEEEDDDDDDEDGTSKGKRKRGKGGAGKGGKKGAAGTTAAAAGKGAPAGSAQTAGDRDMLTGRRKIRIEFIEDDSRRHITFSKRKAGIMKKAYELATLTGTQVLLLIVSQTGLVYTFTTPKLSPVVQQPAGRELIQSCLNAPEGGEGNAGAHDAADESHEADDNRNDTQQDDLVANNYASNFAPHMQPNALQHPVGTDLFHDPRIVMGQPSHMGNLNINMAHLQGLSYGGYPGQQMGLQDQAIQYGSYGL